MIGMKEMREFMSYNIFNTKHRRFDQPVIKCKNVSFRLAAPPSRNHISVSYFRKTNIVFLEFRVNILTNPIDSFFTKAMHPFFNGSFSCIVIIFVFYRKINIRHITFNGIDSFLIIQQAEIRYPAG